MERARAPMLFASRSMIGVVYGVRRMTIRDDVRRVLDHFGRSGHQHERDEQCDESGDVPHATAPAGLDLYPCEGLSFCRDRRRSSAGVGPPPDAAASAVPRAEMPRCGGLRTLSEPLRGNLREAHRAEIGAQAACHRATSFTCCRLAIGAAYRLHSVTLRENGRRLLHTLRPARRHEGHQEQKSEKAEGAVHRSCPLELTAVLRYGVKRGLSSEL